MKVGNDLSPIKHADSLLFPKKDSFVTIALPGAAILGETETTESVLLPKSEQKNPSFYQNLPKYFFSKLEKYSLSRRDFFLLGRDIGNKHFFFFGLMKF